MALYERRLTRSHADLSARCNVTGDYRLRAGGVCMLAPVRPHLLFSIFQPFFLFFKPKGMFR